MDYAKFAYLKTTELEEYNYNLNVSKLSAANAIEFVEPILNKYVASTTDLVCGKINMQGDVVFQDKLIVTSTIEGSLYLEILVGEVAILAEERQIKIGENQLILMRAYKPPKFGEATVCLRITPSNNFGLELTSNTMAIWGMVAESKNISSVEMRSVMYNDNVWVSYIKDKKIMLATLPANEQSILPSQFNLVGHGISHDFATNKQGDMYMFRVDGSGNLFYRPYQQNTTEIKLDTGVSVVSAKTCPDTCPEDILISYIKNGRPFYKVLINDTISCRHELQVPAGNYINISVAGETEGRMFIVCTHTNLSNYILYSVSEKEVEKFVCSLNANVAMLLKRYISVKYRPEDIAPVLNAQVKYNLEEVFIGYKELFNSKIAEHIRAGAKIEYSTYDADDTPTCNYILVCDQKVNTYNLASGEQKVNYLGDCLGWTPVTMNLKKNGTVEDPSGILEKWPFNEIKPCLIKDGEVVGYLNPKNYKKYEDGTSAPSTSPEYMVMVEFPKIYYRFTMDWDGEPRLADCNRNILTVEISNKAKKGFYCASHVRNGVEYDKIYISAYKSQVADNKILSHSGLLCTSTEPHCNVVDYLKTVLDGQYSTLSYNVVNMFMILQMLMFARMESYKDIGECPSNITTTKIVKSGYSDTYGMYHGRSNTNITNQTIKYFGIENIVGGANTIVDGFYLDNNASTYVYNPYNPDCSLDYGNINGYKSFNFDYRLTNGMMEGMLSMFYADNECGLMPLSIDPEIPAYNNMPANIATPAAYKYISADDYPYMQYIYGPCFEPGSFYSAGLMSICSCFFLNPGSTVMGDRLVYYPKSLISN